MIGISEIEINGVKRGFKFGTYQLSIVCDLEGCTLGELGERLSGKSLKTIMHIMYGAAVSYCKSNKITVDFEVHDVADWMDIIGLESGMNLINQGLKTNNSTTTKDSGIDENEKKNSLLKTA